MLKFVLFTILAYLLVRALLNLARAMRREGGRAGGASPNGRRRRSQGDRRRGRATRLREEEEDVEDAKWEDL